jgi:histidine phosphotransferase ChpT
MSKILDFSELLISKLCHDLAAPIGAVYNGVEFLEEVESEDLQQQALNLILLNSKISINKLKFFRYIYGRCDEEGESDLNELKKLVNEFLDESKFSIAWDTELTGDKYVQLTHRSARLMLTLIYVASGFLVQGGKIEVKIRKLEKGKYICVKGEGSNIKNPSYLTEILENNDDDSLLRVDNIIIHLAHKLASHIGVKIKHIFHQNDFTLEFEII